jgi:hypothetical protein
MDIAFILLLVVVLIVTVGDCLLYRRLLHRIGDLQDRLADLESAPTPVQKSDMSAFKLEVAKSYAAVGLVKDVERRLAEHPARIENKIGGAS